MVFVQYFFDIYFKRCQNLRDIFIKYTNLGRKWIVDRLYFDLPLKNQYPFLDHILTSSNYSNFEVLVDVMFDGHDTIYKQFMFPKGL